MLRGVTSNFTFTFRRILSEIGIEGVDEPIFITVLSRWGDTIKSDNSLIGGNYCSLVCH